MENKVKEIFEFFDKYYKNKEKVYECAKVQVKVWQNNIYRITERDGEVLVATKFYSTGEIVISNEDQLDRAYGLLFRCYNHHFPTKRNNWTTQEIVDMMATFPASQESLDWGDYLTERFQDMARPKEEVGAFAYQPRTKSFVHIGTLPENTKANNEKE